jgi:O-antigen/teichoic acid export membrane protein
MPVMKKVLQTVAAYALTTVVGFIGTLYFARTLGAGPIGTYSLGVSIVIWGTVFDFGLGIAAVKRISERGRQSEFFVASLLLYTVIIAVYCIVLFFARDAINSYVGSDVAVLLVLLFAGMMGYGAVTNGIKGLNAVQVKNWIDVVEQTARIAVQATLVAIGLSFAGLYVGYVISVGIGLGTALIYIYTRSEVSLAVPSRSDFQELFDFAKFSWLTRLKSQSVSWMDVFVLGFFVSQSLVGVYQIAWTVSKTFGLLPKAMSSNVFPEVSGLTVDDHKQIQMLVTEGLAYAGYVAIPGTVGAMLLGQRVLGIYGQEFRSGALILVILVAAAAVRGYERHLLKILDSLDHPDITFRVNSVFISVNTGLNVVLIWLYGPVGAAVATFVSTFCSLSLAWYSANQLVDFRLPMWEIVIQVAAALWMGVIVAGLDTIVPVGGLVELIILVGAGGCVYFITTITVSGTIRQKFRSIIGM